MTDNKDISTSVKVAITCLVVFLIAVFSGVDGNTLQTVVMVASVVIGYLAWSVLIYNPSSK